MDKKKVLITCALPYANGALHFGHIAGNFLPGDAYARYQRLAGSDVFFVSGSDEFGVAVTFKAEQMGRTPQEQVEHYHKANIDLLEKMHISLDHFSRTTSPYHVKPTQEFFLDLLESDVVEEIESEHLYSEADDKFLADRYVEGQCPLCKASNARGDECPSCGGSYEAIDLLHPVSKLTKAPLVPKKTRHWFLRLDLFSEKLHAWLETKDWKPNVKNFANSYLKNLKARAITRDGTWGVPLPGQYDEEGKVFYVWFDAPIGYISASMEWAEKHGNKDLWKDFWLDEKTHYAQFMGKDNIFFHAIWFPAMIMGQKKPYKQVDDLFANEFYNLEGKQFSKTDGWYVELEDFFSKYSSDQIRYAIASNAPENSDSEFSWKDFQARCNSDLLGKWGNLVNRVMVFAHRYCDGKVPETKNLEAEDQDFLKEIERLEKAIQKAFDKAQLRLACKHIIELAQAGNAYFDAKKPWAMAKEPSNEYKMRNTIALCLECLKRLAMLSSPVIPDASERVWQFLGMGQKISETTFKEVLSSMLPTGQQMQQANVLFRKIEDEEIQTELDHLQAMSTAAYLEQQGKKAAYFKKEITFQDFEKMDLRIGKVSKAEIMPKSKKLLLLEVDLGVESRKVVSGIFPSYAPKDILGKKVVVVANLKPAKIRGYESQGMILAVDLDDGLEVVEVSKALPGHKVS